MSRILRCTVIFFIALYGLLCADVPFLAAEDYMLAPDPVAQVYRTGTADPVISAVPREVKRLLEISPKSGLKSLVGFFQLQHKNEYSLVKCIHDWITSEIMYDPETDTPAARYSDRKEIPVYVPVLQLGRADHHGFARLFSEMCGLAGIKTVTIHGISNRFLGPDLRPAEHTWNGVEIDGNWYIVDTVHDARNRRLPDGRTETGLYSDRELFLKPEGKILVNFPEDDRFQFLEETVSRKEFLAGPLLELDCARYGVVYRGMDQGSETAEGGPAVGVVPAEAVGISGREPDGRQAPQVFEGVSGAAFGAAYFLRNETELGSGRASFFFSAPEDVRLQVWLIGPDGSRYPRYGFTYREENRHVCTFSLPEPGEYTAEVYGLERGRQSGWRHLFSCTVGGPEKGPTLPVPGIFFKTSGWERSGLEAVDSRIGTSTGGRYVSLTLKVPDNIILEAEVEKDDGSKAASWISVSYPEEGTFRYTIVPKERGKFYVTLRAGEHGGDSRREMGEENVTEGVSGRRHSVMEFAFVNLIPQGKEDFPVHELFLHKSFLSEGFRFVSDNLLHAADDGYYRITVNAPRGLLMDGEIGRDDTEMASGPGTSFVYEKEGTTYSFYFLPGIEAPGEGAVYMLGPSGERVPLIDIVLPRFSSFRPSVHEPGRIYKKNGFEQLGLRLLESNIHRAEKQGYACCALEIPYGLDVFAEYVLLRGGNLSRSHITASTPTSREKRFYFRLPEGGPGIVRLYARKSGQEEVLEFALYPSETARDIPPPGEVIFYRSFYRNGFSLVRENLTAPGAEGYAITLKVPDEQRLRCRIISGEGGELQDRCSYQIRGDEYTYFIETPPEDERWRVDIAAVDSRGVVTDLCRFFVEAPEEKAPEEEAFEEETP